MATVIREIAFKNFYNFYGDYVNNRYRFSEGLNIINADNGMGKSKIFNGFLWIITDQVYDSDIRAKVNANSDLLKLLSDKAKISETSPETGVKIIFDSDGMRYTIEKRVKYTKKIASAATSNIGDWDISEPRIDVICYDLTTRNYRSIYDERDKNDIIKNRLINPEMQSYALLQGEAIDHIVDLSNAKQLAQTVEVLTDITDLKTIAATCKVLMRNAEQDLHIMQNANAINRGRYEQLKNDKERKEINKDQSNESLDNYKRELELATETYELLQSQIANTENRVKYREAMYRIDNEINHYISKRTELLSNVNDNLFKREMPWLLLNMDGYTDTFIKLRDEYNLARYERARERNPHVFYTELPEGSPDDGSLNIMLERGWCFVCDRPAPKGSKEWKHIESVRNRSKRTDFEAISDLHVFFDDIQKNVTAFSNVDSIKGNVAKMRLSLKDISQKITDLEREKRTAMSEYINYGGDSKNINEESDKNLLNRFIKAKEDIEHYKNLMSAAKKHIGELEEEIKRIDTEMRKCVGKDIPNEYQDMVDVIGDARSIFSNTQQRIYDTVINDLETKSNKFYQLLTSGNNVIGGNLKFTKTAYDAIQVDVLTQFGDRLSGASEGFQRMKKIAIVMAIISSKIGDRHFAYPFIADAPFSAFGKNFINNFFDVVPKVFNQSIIMIKDMYEIDAPELITEDGKRILEKMKSGEILGTFYVNAINEMADTTGLETEIKPYKTPVAYE